MKKRNFLFFVLFILLANFIFGAYQYSQRRLEGVETNYYTNISQFGQVLRIINEHYVDDVSVDYQNLTRSALEGLLRSLDPHSEFLPQRKFTELQSQTKQQYGGIGVQIESRDDRITVISPIAGTPGEAAGIFPGDQIVRVDDRNMEQATLEEIVTLLRGEPGEKVKLGLFRPRANEMIEVNITREIIRVDSVRDVRMMEDGIGYVRLTQFGERSGAEFIAALEKLEEEGMKGLILDLRNNPGGLLTASVDVAGTFFDRNEMVVYTQGRDPLKRQEIVSRTSAREKKYPIAVLINSGSASASEIVAGALRDTQRAVIVGETSFGKGSVQSILPLSNGDALRLTTARYYTPAGVTIHEKGVVPDVEVTISLEEERKLRIQRNRPDLLDEVAFVERFGFEPIADKQLEAASDVLKGLFLFSDLTRKEEPAMAGAR